jgi:ATP-binding cassette subfamily A (ABC1) protein 3
MQNIEKVFHKYSFGIKRKEHVKILNKLSLDVPDKELMCILGHNGAGKTTMIDVLTGI